jgi:hypothetical protein
MPQNVEFIVVVLVVADYVMEWMVLCGICTTSHQVCNFSFLRYSPLLELRYGVRHKAAI